MPLIDKLIEITVRIALLQFLRESVKKWTLYNDLVYSKIYDSVFM